MTEAYPAVRNIVEKVVASGLIYLPSHALDFQEPDVDKYLAKYVRGSNGIDYKERIKIMKLLWDAIGTESAARHELDEMNYSGSHELIRVFQLQQAHSPDGSRNGSAGRGCMADYDEDGWKNPAIATARIFPSSTRACSPAAWPPGAGSAAQAEQQHRYSQAQRRVGAAR